MLSVISSIVVALVLSNSFVGFSAGYCITFVLCGTAFGLIWQGRAEVGVGLFDLTCPDSSDHELLERSGFVVLA